MLYFQGPLLVVHPVSLRPRKKCLEWCYTLDPWNLQIQSLNCRKYDYPATTTTTTTTKTVESTPLTASPGTGKTDGNIKIVKKPLCRNYY